MWEGRYGVYFGSRARQVSHAVQMWGIMITRGIGANKSSASRADGWPFSTEPGNLGIERKKSGFDPTEV